MDDSNESEYETTEETNLIFEGLTFDIVGFSEEETIKIINDVKELGGCVASNAEYKFMKANYFHQIQNKDKIDCYNYVFIKHCIEMDKLLDLKQYKLEISKHVGVKRKQSVEPTVNNKKSNGRSCNNKKSKWISKKDISSSSESSTSNQGLEDNLVSSKKSMKNSTNSKKNNLVKKTISHKSLTSDGERSKKGMDHDDIFLIDDDDDDDGESSSWNNKKTKEEAGHSNEDEVALDQSSASDVSILHLSSDDDDNGVPNQYSYTWWSDTEDFIKGTECTLRNCTFEPRNHQRHDPAKVTKKRPFSLVEERIMLKYCIQNDSILGSRGREVWRSMIEEGYLTHRDEETLRGHYTKSMIKRIGTFGLPQKYVRMFEDA